MNANIRTVGVDINDKKNLFNPNYKFDSIVV